MHTTILQPTLKPPVAATVAVALNWVFWRPKTLGLGTESAFLEGLRISPANFRLSKPTNKFKIVIIQIEIHDLALMIQIEIEIAVE